MSNIAGSKQRLMQALCRGCRLGWKVANGQHLLPTPDPQILEVRYSTCVARQALNGHLPVSASE